MKLVRLGVGFLEDGEDEMADWTLAEAREDITPPMMAMPMVPKGGSLLVCAWWVVWVWAKWWL